MKNAIRKVLQFFEMVKDDGLRITLKQIFHINRVAIPLFVDLPKYKPNEKNLDRPDLEWVAINPEAIKDLSFCLKNRAVKSHEYLKKGYQGFGAVKDGLVIGDVWYASKKTTNHMPPHTDLKWLKKDFKENDVYLYDMYVKTDERGNNIAGYLMVGMLKSLKEEGYQTAHCYVMADNLPAVWMHKMAGFKEEKDKPRKVSTQFLFYKTTRNEVVAS